MGTLKVLSLLTILLMTSFTDAAYPLKILGLFPHPAVSHFNFFQPLLRGLAEVGHDVTVVSHFPDKNPPARYTNILLTGQSMLTNSVDLKWFENRRFYTNYLQFFLLHEWGREACNATLKSDALMQVLHSKKKFDVILVEQFNSDCMNGVAHVLKAPVIALSSCALLGWHYERFGNPFLSSYMPNAFLGFSEEMNFFERLTNWMTHHWLAFMYSWMTVPATDALLRYKFGHDLPSVADLAKNTSLILVNQHYSLSGVKPLPPSVVEIGGIHIQKAKPIEPEIQRILDSAEHGVIFISWGSMINAQSLSDDKRDSILRAIRRLKQTVIWKWENETLSNKPDNLHIRKWLQQREILCHPNVKIFMTHGGLMGSSEAAYCGVPVISTPFYGDQFLNSAALKQRGMGIILEYESISENTVFRSIKKVLEQRYADNAKLVSHSYKHRPQAALQTGIWWVEYVARTEGAPLTRSHSVIMSKFAYYSLDVYLFLAVLCAIIIGNGVIVIKKIYVRFAKAKKPKTE